MEQLFGNYSLGRSHFSYMNNVFGINFAMIYGWSVIGIRITASLHNINVLALTT